MHIRNRYFNNKPNFLELSKKYPGLKSYIKINKFTNVSKIDFKDPKAVRELTYALLWCDFKLRLEIPLDSLCPIIPGRLDYIHWLEDLINNEKLNENGNNEIYFINNKKEENEIFIKHGNAEKVNKNKVEENENKIKGIDIGTGASCIYPLLACKIHSNWNFLALDINERSIEYAKENRNRNNLKNQIKIKQIKMNENNDIFSSISRVNKIAKKKERPIYQYINKLNNLAAKKNNSKDLKSFLKKELQAEFNNNTYDFDFCMCNPPFYTSELEMQNCKELKVEEPTSINTGGKNEVITEGGEVQFIKNLISSSLNQYKKKIKYINKIKKGLNSIHDTPEQLNYIIKNIKKLNSKGLTVRWYTSLIGKKSSIDPILEYLKQVPLINCIKTIEFRQGKTTRWGIAWSYSHLKI